MDTMSSIEQQAAEVIDRHIGFIDYDGSEHTNAAQALARTGLLKDDTELNRIKRELVALRERLEKSQRLDRAFGTSVGGKIHPNQITRILEGNQS